MKGNDLRLGNWIMGIGYMRVTELKTELGNNFITASNKDVVFMDEEDSFQPIELTEEVLLKIGFDAMHENRYMYEKSIINKHNINDDVYVTFHIINKTLKINFSKNLQILNLYDIKYLHQLQNAYYCLTGKELEVEL